MYDNFFVTVDFNKKSHGRTHNLLFISYMQFLTTVCIE